MNIFTINYEARLMSISIIHFLYIIKFDAFKWIIYESQIPPAKLEACKLEPLKAVILLAAHERLCECLKARCLLPQF